MEKESSVCVCVCVRERERERERERIFHKLIYHKTLFPCTSYGIHVGVAPESPFC